MKSTEQERAEFLQMHADFEREFGPMPQDCKWSGTGFYQTSHHAWKAQEYAHKFDGFKAAWQAARRAPAVTDTRARYSGSIQELKQYASEDVDAMVHICNKHIGNVPKGFFLAMQECAALVGRAPAAPVHQDAATHNKNLNGFIDFANQIDFANPRSASLKRKFILETRDAILDLFRDNLKLHRKVDALASAPQPPEAAQASVSNGTLAAPVQMPEPAAWRYTDARGHYRYRGARPGFAVEYPLLKPEALYTEQQVRQLLEARGIEEPQ